MGSTPQDILERFSSLKKSTNINNTNNTNNTNNKTTTIIVDEINNVVVNQSLRSSFGLASRTDSSPKGIHLESGSELPAPWMNCKWDLFRNPSPKSLPQLRLNLNIIRLDGTRAKFTASLNSPQDRIWRKVTDEERKEPHWLLIQEQYYLWRREFGTELIDWRASKFYLPGKKESGETTIFFKEYMDRYQLRLFYRAAIWDYAILKSSAENLSLKQIQGNQIATAFIGRQARRLATADDWGI